MKKNIFTIGILVLFILSIANCNSSKKAISITDDEKAAFSQTKGDTIAIKDDKTEYEIMIIEPGFDLWLQSIAKPEGFYSQSYLENRNRIYVLEWNQRVTQPFRYNSNLYELQIDYNSNTDYGYEVNYKLYNYFIYFQRKYNQRLGPFVPRI
jgi:signal peptidase I